MPLPDYNKAIQDTKRSDDLYQIKNVGRNKKLDKRIVGFFIGLITPAIGIVLLYFVLFRKNYDFATYLTHFDFSRHYSSAMASKVLGLSTLLNLLPFYYFLNKKYYALGQGIIGATFLYCIVFGIYKFVLS